MLRALWRRRLALGVGAAAAIALAVAFARPASTPSALAHTRVALDTPRSQLVASAPNGADTLPWRASLVAHLMATESSARELARRMGVPRDSVAVVDPALAVPELPASIPQAVAKVAAVTVAPYVLTVSLPDATLPIVEVGATAPDRAGADRLARAAVALLEAHASRGGAYASRVLTDPAGAPRLQPFVVTQVAPVRVRRLESRRLPIKRLGLIVVVLGTWCAVVVLLPRRAGPRKIAAA